MSSFIFDATSLERRYAFLDDCPEALLPQVITLPIGTLSERVAGVLSWRKALLAGQLPPTSHWPSAEVSTPVRRALKDMGLVRFCKEQPELVDTLLADILSAFARRNDELSSAIVRRLRELEELERRRLEQEEALQAKRKQRPPLPVQLTPAIIARLEEQAKREIARRKAKADSNLMITWGERTRIWAQIADVFGDLGQMLGRGWDLAQGVLHHTGWTKLLRLRKLLEQLPQLQEIIRTLGRLQFTKDGECVADKIFKPVRRLEEEYQEVHTPYVPIEARGVEHSGDIARMLPVEAAMLGHPKLRLLWHARRAERTLITYRVEGTEIERYLVERESQEEIESQAPRPERGPIIAVIDTSGSMHGLPEQIAKALVLEAMRVAHAEQRRCYLYAYSGPGDVLEYELDLGPNGIARLLTFLAFSFGAGTDIEVMKAVTERLKHEQWQKADVLLVSDGEWAAPVNIVQAVKQARQQGSRFHGVQIGNRGPTSMQLLCDPVHCFLDWTAVVGW